ncbi:MAG: hypothetical protein AABX47_10180 [Nanoarchaeota archaeon]
MALNTLVIGARERDAFKDLVSRSRDLQGVVLYTAELQGAACIDQAFGIVVSGQGEPFSDSSYDRTIDDKLDLLYEERPEIKALDFHLHSSALCSADQSLARDFSVADGIQLAINARHPDYRILFGSPHGLSLTNIITSAEEVSSSPAPLEYSSGVRANINIDAAHAAYGAILNRLGLTMHRVAAPSPAARPPAARPAAPAPAPAAPAQAAHDPAAADPSTPDSSAPAAASSSNPSPAAKPKLNPMPLGWYTGKYFIAAYLVGTSYPAHALSKVWEGPAKAVYDYGSHGMFAVGCVLGAYTLLKHLRNGSK